MVDKPGDATPAKESQSAMHKQTKTSKKPKNATVLKAVEDIQRMSPEAIRKEFDRMVEHTKRHYLIEDIQQPCANVAHSLLRCLRQHPQQSCQCFRAMEDYRQCVKEATQRQLDRLADEELQRQGRRPPPPLVVVPPESVPQANTTQPKVVVCSSSSSSSGSMPIAASSRSWYKPWTWLH